MVVCLTTFRRPTDQIKAQDGGTHSASDYGRGMLNELATADTTLAKHSQAAAAGAALARGHSEADVNYYSVRHYERHRTDLSFARSKLLGWLGEREQQAASVAVKIPAPAMISPSDQAREEESSSEEDEACVVCT